jgi:hypothetical protein
MAVNELDRDHMKLLHMCDAIENIINGMKMTQETDSEKKKQVGNMVMHLEMEALDSKYADAGKDMTRINSVITSGRTYWKS